MPINNLYIKFTWLIAPKSKLKQTSNLKKSTMAHLYQAQKKRNKKTEDVLTSIIMVLTDDMFGII